MKFANIKVIKFSLFIVLFICVVLRVKIYVVSVSPNGLKINEYLTLSQIKQSSRQIQRIEPSIFDEEYSFSEKKI